MLSKEYTFGNLSVFEHRKQNYMNIEVYKKELTDWKKKHTNFYNEYVHAMKNKRATLTAYMHIYEFAMTQIPNLPDTVELGECDDLFNIYYTKYGFNELIGMLVSVWANDKILAIKSFAQREKLKKAIVTWLVLGDLHTCIVNKVNSYPDRDNYEEGLNKLLCRIIRNSIITGIKDKSYWLSSQIQTKISLPNDELETYLSIPKQENSPEKTDSVVSEDIVLDATQTNSIVMSVDGEDSAKAPSDNDVISIEENESEEYGKGLNAPINTYSPKSNRGTKPGFANLKEKSLAAIVESTIENNNEVDCKKLAKSIVSEIEKCKEDRDRAPLIVALEICGIIPILKGKLVSAFCIIVNSESKIEIQYRNFTNYYNEYAELRNKVPHEDKNVTEKNLQEIINWRRKFQEMLLKAKKSS